MKQHAWQNITYSYTNFPTSYTTAPSYRLHPHHPIYSLTPCTNTHSFHFATSESSPLWILRCLLIKILLLSSHTHTHTHNFYYMFFMLLLSCPLCLPLAVHHSTLPHSTISIFLYVYYYSITHTSPSTSSPCLSCCYTSTPHHPSIKLYTSTHHHHVQYN